MTLKVIYFIFLVIFSLKSQVSCEKYEHIGDCNWAAGSEHDQSLTFICYDHFHQDRFFDYDTRPKPCLNYQTGYLKDDIGRIRFQNCQLSKVPHDIIEYYRFAWWLNISDVGLEFLTKLNFNGKYEQKLRTLLASHNKLIAIGAGLFDNAKHLRDVDFSFNNISRIDSSAFTKAIEMQSLDLSRNKLSTFVDGTFRSLNKLKTLILRNNNIVQVDSKTFSGPTSLNKLDLSYNKIQRLDIGIFADNLLNVLNLSHNEIDDIYSDSLGLNQLGILDLSYNNILNFNITLLQSIPELTQLNISHNQIESGNGFAFSNKLTVLDASHNSINDSSQHIFDSLSHLMDLNLSFNPLKCLKPELFANLTNLKYLRLTNANLTKIDHGTFFKLTHLQTLDLSRNDFKTIDFNVFLPNLSELNSLFLDGNQLSDLIGFRRSLFPNLKDFSFQNNNLNCSSLRTFFEFVVWHELNIKVDRTQTFQMNEKHVGGIKCVEKQNEPNEYDAKASTIIIPSPTIQSSTVSFVSSSIWTSTTTPPPLTPSVPTPHTSRETHSKTTHAPTQTASHRSIELLLSILCVILVALLIVHIIINRAKICSQFNCNKFMCTRNDHYTMTNSELTVAFSTQ